MMLSDLSNTTTERELLSPIDFILDPTSPEWDQADQARWIYTR